MLNVGIIGIGNTGNQIAALGKKRLDIPVMAINSSEKDLETIDSDIPSKLIRDKEGLSAGAGKDRNLAKKYLKESIQQIISSDDVKDMIGNLDIVYIVSSTGGGTGSGTAPIMASIISGMFPDTTTILIGVMPTNNEGYSSHVNTLEYLNELYNVLNNQTYMLYDNDKCSGLPSYKILEKVNNEVISDIDVMRCTYNHSTQYDSIDDRDMTRLISFPGRILIARLEDFKEKDCDNQTIEDMLIDNIKKNCHAEAQRDKKVMATGIITNLSETLNQEFHDSIPAVQEFMGSAVHEFKHIKVNEERSLANNVFYIASGLTPVNDRINKISDRISEIEEAQKVLEEESALSSLDLEGLSESITDKEKQSSDEFDVGNVFSSFGL